MVVDEKDHHTWLNAAATLRGKAGLEWCRNDQARGGLLPCDPEKGFPLCAEASLRWSLVPVIEIVEDTGPDPFHRIRA
jgi:hypothetical protein